MTRQLSRLCGLPLLVLGAAAAAQTPTPDSAPTPTQSASTQSALSQVRSAPVAVAVEQL